MVQAIEQDETKFQFNDTEDDVFSVAGVLKQCTLTAAMNTRADGRSTRVARSSVPITSC